MELPDHLNSAGVTEQYLVDIGLMKEMFLTTADRSCDIIVSILPDGSITFANKAFIDFFGLEKEDIIGKNLFQITSHEETDRGNSFLKAISEVHPLRKEVFDYPQCDDSVRYIEWSGQFFFDGEGNISRKMLFGREVTKTAESDIELKLTNSMKEVDALRQKLEAENLYLRNNLLVSKGITGVVSQSPAMHEVLIKVGQVAKTDSPVLIYGETGTGKEMMARMIHGMSSRSKRLMITVNCAALPSTLIESELFGRERGAYTGALSSQVGRFELANGSTIFLDEIGELSLETQVKLLRVIQFGEYEVLGNPRTRKVDVRIIAATNKELTQAMADGSFRSDLFYRLNVFPITIPPLRDRKEDIPTLAWQFVDEIGAKMGKHIEKISTCSMKRMLGHSWPGNIRELRNAIEYSLILSPGHILEVGVQDQEKDTDTSLESQQRKHILTILNITNWRVRGKGGAAELLGMKESTLRFRMKKLGIKRIL